MIEDMVARKSTHTTQRSHNPKLQAVAAWLKRLARYGATPTGTRFQLHLIESGTRSAIANRIMTGPILVPRHATSATIWQPRFGTSRNAKLPPC